MRTINCIDLQRAYEAIRLMESARALLQGIPGLMNFDVTPSDHPVGEGPISFARHAQDYLDAIEQRSQVLLGEAISMTCGAYLVYLRRDLDHRGYGRGSIVLTEVSPFIPRIIKRGKNVYQFVLALDGRTVDVYRNGDREFDTISLDGADRQIDVDDYVIAFSTKEAALARLAAFSTSLTDHCGLGKPQTINSDRLPTHKIQPAM